MQGTEVKILLNKKSKMEVLKLYKNLNPLTISSCINHKYYNNLSSKIIFTTSNRIATNVCDFDSIEMEKKVQLYLIVKKHLQKSQEFKQTYPWEALQY